MTLQLCGSITQSKNTHALRRHLNETCFMPRPHATIWSLGSVPWKQNPRKWWTEVYNIIIYNKLRGFNVPSYWFTVSQQDHTLYIYVITFRTRKTLLCSTADEHPEYDSMCSSHFGSSGGCLWLTVCVPSMWHPAANHDLLRLHSRPLWFQRPELENWGHLTQTVPLTNHNTKHVG